MDVQDRVHKAFQANQLNDVEDMHWTVCEILGIKGVNVGVVNLPKAKAIFAPTMAVGQDVHHVIRHALLLKACGALIAVPGQND